MPSGKRDSSKRGKEDSSKRGREGSSTDVAQPKRQKKQPVPVYGNYHFYYSYRIGQALDEDPRLNLFRSEWFEYKDCLDIGCNEGYVTITIAQMFGCKSILGVDIDSSLISVAYRHLQKESAQGGGARNGLAGLELLRKVHFLSQNYLESPVKPDRYDTILCLSVTKWIHLNWGDAGLLKFFAKMREELRPGGMLVLEPQPWTSYKRKSQFSEVTRRNYKEAALRPENFQQVLIEKIGFKSFEEVTSAVPNSTTGFARPLFLYYT